MPAGGAQQGPSAEEFATLGCYGPASQHGAGEAATDSGGCGGPKRPVHVVKGSPTWGRDEAASTGVDAPAGGRVEAPAAERDEKQADHEAPTHASFWTAGPSP
jgi:hypothetical protein